ncbi:HAMP domain-containing sensor histidine kinase [Actinocrispum sp. NPDC049592]|uniref:sensor histidine kinase n=1 Tax=Actinocrispum sp. NPDC049592 TaxID=3154835 RepID=UPI0034271577
MTARARLALLYTGLVLLAGVALTGLTYLLMREGLGHRILSIRISGAAALPPLPDDQALRDLREATLSELLGRASIALAVVTVLAAVLGWLVAGRILRPVRAISATARRLSAEDLSGRVPVKGPRDELAALASTVNGMLDRIERGVAERDQALAGLRLFTANAAHELRTPLTTMRTAIDVTLDGDPSPVQLRQMACDVRAAVSRSQRTLDGLLALARSQASTGDRHPVDLASVVDIADADVTVETCLEHAPVRGQPVLLERMAGNLVENALRYNHPGGYVRVVTGTDGGTAFLRVINTGRPIAPDTVDGLLEPFVRGPGGRAGAGLGLSIVRAIVLAHDGWLSVSARPGGGLDVTVRFPVRAAGRPEWERASAKRS